MRVAVIADIHGNLIALEAVLHDLEQQISVDQVVIAGDLCLNGPRPLEVLQKIRSLGYPVIQGNVDREVVNQTPTRGPKKRNVIAWTRDQIGEEGIAYLESLSYDYTVTNPNGSDVLVVHANPLNQEEALFPTAPDSMLEHLLGELPPTIGAVAFGHFHVAYIRRWRHLLLVDAGSCGLPRDEDQRASYAILNWRDTIWQAEIRRVAYDVRAVVEQLKTCGIPHAEKRINILVGAKY